MNQLLTLRFNKRTVLYFILFLPFIQQRTISEIPISWLWPMYRYYLIVSSICMLIIFAIDLNKVNVAGVIKKFRLYGLFWGLYVITTLISYMEQLSYTTFFSFVFLALGLFLCAELQLYYKNIIHALSMIYMFFILANTILMILFPEGLYQTEGYHTAYLLGDSNALIFVMLPGITLILIDSIIRKGKITAFSYFILAIVFLTQLVEWSVSALMSIALFVFLILVANKVIKLTSRKLLVFFCMLIVLILFGTSNPVIKAFIEEGLNKDITFSNRTIVWAMAIQMIAQSPLVGFGGYFQQGSFKVTTNSWYTYPCHTTYLQILIDGGILLFVPFVLLIVRAFSKMQQYRNSEITRILACGMVCMMLNYLFEYSYLWHFMILIVIAINIDCFFSEGNYQYAYIREKEN